MRRSSGEKIGILENGTAQNTGTEQHGSRESKEMRKDRAEPQGDSPLLATKALQEPDTKLPNFTCVWDQAQKRHPQNHP